MALPPLSDLIATGPISPSVWRRPRMVRRKSKAIAVRLPQLIRQLATLPPEPSCPFRAPEVGAAAQRRA